MIKQFNFYDVYGYLFPGVVLLGLLWVPIGVVSRTWPEQDISKALFLAVLSYIVGHLLQAIAHDAVPSKVVRDTNMRWRFPSDRLLDKNDSTLGEGFKTRLAEQVKKQFKIDLVVAQDATDEISRNRSTAFFQARSYLLAKKTAQYVEQFEGLYAMMRGLACAFLAGAVYLGGWSLAYYHFSWSPCLFVVLPCVAGLVALGSSIVVLCNSIGVLLFQPKCRSCAPRALAVSLLVVFSSAGFWAATWQPEPFWKNAPSYTESVLWLSTVIALIAALQCFSSYRFFAIQFARSVWQDFSVHLTVRKANGAEAKGDLDEEDTEED